jgi:hypothetical protein
MRLAIALPALDNEIAMRPYGVPLRRHGQAGIT